MADSAQMLSEAVAHHRAGRLAEAEDLYRRALAQNPRDPDALNLLGVLRAEQGDAAAGLKLIREALALRPGAAPFHNNLGKLLADRKDWAAAVASHRRAVELAPDYTDGYFNLGVALAGMGDKPGAEAAYRRTLELAPQDLRARHNLGAVLYDAGRVDEAEPCFRAVLEAKPDDVHAMAALGHVHRMRGEADAAEAHFRAALALRPDIVSALCGLAVIRHSRFDFDTAESLFRRAIELGADDPPTLMKHAAILMCRGDFPAAFAHYRRLAQTHPSDPVIHRDRMVASLYHPDMDETARFAEHLEFGRAMQARVARPLPAPRNDPDPRRRIRIGWLSSDFQLHPVSRCLRPLFLNRDRTQWEAICYAEVERSDRMAEWFRGNVDVWRPTVGLGDDAVAEMIRADQIDVMVYLGGRFDRNRPQVAAWRPAPVQVSFHDPATSGLAAMDYIVADPVLSPRRTEEQFTEKVARVPGYFAHEAPVEAPDVNKLPLLANRHVTFGCFNNPMKINDRVLEVWADVLRRTPGARLLLKYWHWFGNASLQERVRRGLGPGLADRVDFGAEFQVFATHLELYHKIDIGLDPFPFTGATTTFEAAWMGVPVVTIPGPNMAARWSATILHTIKADELIATSLADYVDRAVALANDPTHLGELRATLRDRVARSPICDGPLRARQIERLLRALWCRWCVGRAG